MPRESAAAAVASPAIPSLARQHRLVRGRAPDRARAVVRGAHGSGHRRLTDLFSATSANPDGVAARRARRRTELLAGRDWLARLPPAETAGGQASGSSRHAAWAR